MWYSSAYYCWSERRAHVTLTRKLCGSWSSRIAVASQNVNLLLFISVFSDLNGGHPLDTDFGRDVSNFVSPGQTVGKPAVPSLRELRQVMH